MRAGDAVLDMAYFRAQDAVPAAVCREVVVRADVYVVIAGMRYGSRVPDRPTMSYTEWEFETATAAGIPRLVFLLDEDAHGLPDPADDEDRLHQVVFRSRLLNAGTVVSLVSSPSDLELTLLHALTGQTLAPAAAELDGCWNLPPRSGEFIGRREVLRSMASAFDPVRGRSRVHVLIGMAGAGKTMIATEFAYVNRRDYDIAWWISAEAPLLIADQLAQLAQALRLVDASAPIALGVATLLDALRVRERCLLVFDNARDPAALLPYLVEGPGHTIITSRNPDWRGTAQLVRVEPFDRSDAVELIRSHLPEIENVDADRLAAALGDLPLAVDQAGALLADTAVSVDAYLRQLSELDDRALGGSVDGGAAPESVWASWTVAFDRMEVDDLAAFQILILAAWLAPEPVPITALIQEMGLLPAPLRESVGDSFAVAARLSVLRRRGLAQVWPDSLRLHRVPAGLLRRRSQSTRVGGTSWAATAVAVLRAAAPAGPWNNPPSWPAWQRLLPHVLVATDTGREESAVLDDTIWLLRQAGDYLHTRGDALAARPLFEKAYSLSCSEHGEDDPRSLMAANDVAVVLVDLGEREHARDLNRDSLERVRRVLGPDHRESLISANNLARVLSAMGDHGSARELNEDTLGRFHRLAGPDHPDALASATNLAQDLDALGSFREAADLNEDTCARLGRVFGPDHPSTLGALNNLALNLRHLGQLERSRQLDEEVLSRRRRLLGSDHPDTLASMNNLVRDLHELGRHDEATPLIEEAVTRLGRVLGVDHPYTLTASDSFAGNLFARGKLRDARRRAEETLRRRQEVLGEEHPQTVVSAEQVASIRRAIDGS